MLYSIILLATLCAPALYLIFGRPRRVPDSDEGDDRASISIIIPARNEEQNIAPLLDSISVQGQAPVEVIVVDDGSTDRTAEVARQKGATVVQPEDKPEDWKGKPWACQQGAGQARGDWFLFLDADTRLLPGAVEKLAALTEQENRVFSLCPYHEMEDPYEQLSSFFNVIMVAGSNAFAAGSDSSREAALFGQVLLISKQHYREVGGHETVRAEVLENFHLAQHLKQKGVRCECFLGKGTVSMRMFPEGFRQLWDSWKKGFIQGAQETAPRALLLISLWLSGAMFTLVAAVVACTPIASHPFQLSAGAIYLLYFLTCLYAFRQVGHYSFWNAALFPISLLFYQALFFIALVERRLGIKTQWKGRDVD